MSEISKIASGLTSKVSEITESVGDLSRAAGRTLNDAQNETAAAFHTAASSVRTKGRKTSDKIENLTTGVADKLDATASYIYDHNMRKAGAKIRRFVSRRQTRFLLAAVGIGFVAGAAFRRLIARRSTIVTNP